MVSLRLLAALACATLAIPNWAQAQDYPSRPIRIIHGFTPGGPVDITARLMAQAFNDRFGQQAIVEG
jgi:tripartite-type tricarboxylate transporter receptor subunit TctC